MAAASATLGGAVSAHPGSPALLRGFARLSRLAGRLYYRFTVAGAAVPGKGPLLLVANHPNSLLDPVLVAAAAGRPVRFLAKAPLFGDPKVGWMVRAAGAIPVYRRQDDPALMDRNLSAFRAVHEALAGGAAVGIFPEGLSHSEPSLARLRTGTARIALGAARRLGAPFPIVPVGIVLRRKERFRSPALAVVGEPVRWEELSGRPEEDVHAVRELTDRVESALREVTLNLERWDDAPAVEAAEAIYAAEFDLPEEPAERVRRLRQVSEALRSLRRQEPERLEVLLDSVRRFAATLEMLGTTAAGLDRPAGMGAAAGWFARRLAFFLLAGIPAAAGHLAFAVPWELTRRLVSSARLEPDVRATWKLLGGIPIYAVWILFLSGLTAALVGPGWGAAALAGLPVLGALTLWVRERWDEARADARRWLLLRRRGELRSRLLGRRAALAARMEALRGSPSVGEEAGG